MDNIGKILKEKRESKNLTLNDIYAETGIAKKYLEALENSDFLKFPNKVYARSYLRDYANYLCLDSCDLLEKFEAVYSFIKEGPAEKEEEQPETLSEEPDVKYPIELPNENSFLGKTVGIFIIFILLCGGAYLIGKNKIGFFKTDVNTSPAVQTDNKKPDIPVVKQAEQITAEKAENKAGEKPQEAKKETVQAVKEQTNPQETPKPAVKPQPAKPVKKVGSLTIYADKELWVRVEADGKRVFEGTVPGGKNRVFSVKDNIKIRGGEASICHIVADGKNMGKLGTPGQPFNITMKTGPNGLTKK